MSEYIPTEQDLAELDEFYRQEEIRWWEKDFEEWIDRLEHMRSLVED